MEVFFPGSEGCVGVAEPFGDDLEICFDVETGEPLSIIIPGFPGWLAEQQGKPSPALLAYPLTTTPLVSIWRGVCGNVLS